MLLVTFLLLLAVGVAPVGVVRSDPLELVEGAEPDTDVGLMLIVLEDTGDVVLAPEVSEVLVS